MLYLDQKIALRDFLFLMSALFLLSALYLSSCKQIKTEVPVQKTETFTISFGSCNKEDEAQDYWPHIAALNPDLWIWMGDNIYGDSNDPDFIAKAYQVQKGNSYYQQFIANHQILGTWDDHDYGMNDGNKNYMYKEECKKLLIDFLDYPEIISTAKREGVYHAKDLAEGRIKVLLLDTRSFQDVLEKNPDPTSRYHSSENGDILGEEQWEWLETELQKSQAALNIIVSSIQFLAEDQGFEKWANFPSSKKRFIEMLKNNGDKKCLVLSGDRHIAEISRQEFPQLNYPLYDITSSGLTHSYETATENNKHRIDSLVRIKNFGSLKVFLSEGLDSSIVRIHAIDGRTLIKHKLEL